MKGEIVYINNITNSIVFKGNIDELNKMYPWMYFFGEHYIKMQAQTLNCKVYQEVE